MPTPETNNRSTFKRQCSMLAAALWIAATVSMFLFDKNSKWLWLSDTLLIWGFWPVLFYFRPVWTWFVFGTLCLLIGVEISACAFMSDAALPPAMVPVKQHILEHHKMDPWLLLGLASIFYGIIRTIKNLVTWIKRRSTN